MKLKTNLKLINVFFVMLFVTANTFGATKIEEIFKGKTEIKDPMALRDPFLSPKIRRKEKEKIASKVSKGVYSNIPQIGEVTLDKLQIIGVIIGPNRRAFAKISGAQESGGETFVLKEGMKLGQNKATLKAILPGGIVLVEKNTNIYGEDEYLETVIPISK